MSRLVLLLLLSFFFFFKNINAQIVNTEELRFNVEDEKLVGLIDLDFGLTRNKAGMSLRPEVDVRLELKNPKSRWIALGGYNLTRFTNLSRPGSLPSNFTNRGFAHLRYNYSLSSKITIEAFSQFQFDEIQEIDKRILNGFGPRLELAQTDSAHLYIGALYMYEYEETSDQPGEIIYNNDNRLSSYVSFGYQFNEYVNISNVTYFQPNLSDWDDYRITSNLVLSAGLNQWLAFRMSFNLVYDNRPPVTVPPAMYDLSTGFSFRF
jgi:hypothetical protein